MKVFTRDYRIKSEYPEVFARYFEGMRPCVLDIESTGLDPSRCKAVLAGLLTPTDNGVRVTQFLAENHYEEDRVLNATMEFLEEEDIDYLITFNGQAFDIPFLNSRLERTFDKRRISLYGFDLYRFLQKCTDLRSRLPSMSQKSLEQHFGIISDRNDTISGRESVAMFDEYSLTGNSTLEKIILTHNREDVLHLHRLMLLSLGETADFDAAMALYGFPVLGGRFSCRPYISKAKKLLRINGDQITAPVSAAYFPDLDCPVTAVFAATTSTYEIDAPAGRLGDDFYIDLTPLGIRLSSDPDCINNYLILNSRTINLISRLILEQFGSRLSEAS
ncbi:MAG: ribonuclease H-like domain-containing protein [Mogibacterium sp.]|nr:ribonuclease H-like domain-containing protein [Mogibacterium sp.]